MKGKSEKARARGQAWTPEEMLDALVDVHRRTGAFTFITGSELERVRSEQPPGRLPGDGTVFKYFGSWERVRELLRDRAGIAPDESVIFGERGVLAYDDLEDRLQCHCCGRWYTALQPVHLMTHGLTVPEYKELYGFNRSTPLQTPGYSERQRRLSFELDRAAKLKPVQKGEVRGTPHSYPRTAEHFKKHGSIEAARRHGVRRSWTREDMVEGLKRLQAVEGGYLTREFARLHAKELDAPPYATAVRRLGGWRNVCRVLDQPYEPPQEFRSRPPVPDQDRIAWSHPFPVTPWRRLTDDQIVEAFRQLEVAAGAVLTIPGYLDVRRRLASGAAGLPGTKGIRLRFGSWPKLRALIGTPDPGFRLTHGTVHTRWTRETVVLALDRMRKEMGGKVPALDDLAPARRPAHGGPYPSKDTVYEKFGSWIAAKEALLERTRGR